jgi:hypothetical protein
MNIDHPRANLVSQICPCCINGRVDHYIDDRAYDRACGMCGGSGWTISEAPRVDPATGLVYGFIGAVVDQAEARMDAAGIPKLQTVGQVAPAKDDAAA